MRINNIIFGLLTLVLAFVFIGCEKDQRFAQFPDLEKGAYARLLSKTGSFILTDVANSVLVMDVEFYDENQGRNVSSYDWTVAFIDKANSGANSKPHTDILKIPSSSFGTSADGLPSTTVTISLQDALDVFGFSIDDINGADQFEFSATVVMNDGRTFAASNTGGNVIGSAPFSGWFQFRQDVICTSDLAGNYSVYTVYDQHDFLPTYPENTMDMELKEVGDATYLVPDFSGGLYGTGEYVTGYGTTALAQEITDACGNITFAATDPWQNLLQDPDKPSKVDFDTGKLSISVIGDVYGEAWTSVYTPK